MSTKSYGPKTMSEGHAIKSTNATKLVAIVLGLPWVEILTDAWKLGRKVLRGLANEGMYEMLDYESTLTLHDIKGKRARLHKRMKVRYLQDNIIAFPDYAWGEGKFLMNYKSSPGIKVDQYQLGYKTYMLLSLREVKNRGDVDEHNIEWDIHDGFLKKDGFWETSVTSRMKRLKVSVIFPKGRPPLHLVLIEGNRRRTHILGKEHIKKLPDGRWKVSWENQKPKLYEHYLLKWEW
ncbi:MAG: hypothetical protein IIC79_02295 [Chloroflexi bacterium]|nr:hypothetical protein [Chloroflexota bacterium]